MTYWQGLKVALAWYLLRNLPEEQFTNALRIYGASYAQKNGLQ